MKTILMCMKSARTRRLQVLSETVVATLFLCQVVGSLCLMVPPVMVTRLTIHDAHAGHMMMADTRMCQDSVPSSSEPQGAPDAPAHSLLECLHSAVSVQPSALSAYLILATAPSSASAPPLYTRLSTFRI